MKKSTQTVIAFIFGVTFLSLMLVIAIFIPYPSEFRLLTFRVTLALAAGGIAAMLPGFLAVQWSTFVRAGGALAAFAVVFFFNPASLTIEGKPTGAEGVFVKELSEDDGLVEYYWKQGDLKFRFPSDGWRISTKAANAGLGDMTLEHESGKDAQIQLHVSLLDDKYRENWAAFRTNTVNLWEGTIKQFGQFTSEDTFVDGRAAFLIDGTIQGERQGKKEVTLLYAPLGDNRLFEMHLTRNENHEYESALQRAYKLIMSTIRFERENSMPGTENL